MTALATVATLEARILQLRRVPAFEPVGYGATGIADTERFIATIDVGYADGLPRVLSGHGYCAVLGAGVPIVGRVSMDLTTIDVTGLADAVKVGDWVELIGAAGADRRRRRTRRHEYLRDTHRTRPAQRAPLRRLSPLPRPSVPSVGYLYASGASVAACWKSLARRVGSRRARGATARG